MSKNFAIALIALGVILFETVVFVGTGWAVLEKGAHPAWMIVAVGIIILTFPHSIPELENVYEEERGINSEYPEG